MGHAQWARGEGHFSCARPKRWAAADGDDDDNCCCLLLLLLFCCTKCLMGKSRREKRADGEIGVTAAAEKRAPGGIWADGRDRQQRQKARWRRASFLPRPLRRRRRRLSLPIALSLRAAIDGDRIAKKKEKGGVSESEKGKTDLTLISPRTPEREEDNRSKQARGAVPIESADRTTVQVQSP